MAKTTRLADTTSAMGATSERATLPLTGTHDGEVSGAQAATFARTTLAALARAAGVNKSTASRALREDSSIGRETRQRIRALAEELHYEPNASARRLSHARTEVLAFASHTFIQGRSEADPFLVELLGAVMREAGEVGFDILLCRPATGPKEVSVYRRVVGGHHADGFILMNLRAHDPRLPYLREQGFPHVLFGRPDEDLALAHRYPYPWVDVDNRSGARIGVEHLIHLGRRRIAFLGGGDTYIAAHDRFTGYRDALAAADIPFDAALCASPGISQEDGYRLTRDLLVGQAPPTAIFAFSDMLAVGAMRAVQEVGLLVGRDIAVMGFDGLGLGAYVTPQLTTIRQPLQQVGALLVRLLIAALKGEAPQGILLQPELVVRASTQSSLLDTSH
ncbi:MAG: LacI family DNA-binding transcriptional regulator [Ktedonobacterales bacterium]